MTYQHLDTRSRSYDQVEGTGSPGFTVDPVLGGAPLVLPPNYNSPLIRTSQYRSVENEPTISHINDDQFSLNLNWHLLGQQLQYIFGYEPESIYRTNSNNPANMLIGFDDPQVTNSDPYFSTSHEIRLSSQPGNHWLDYQAGVYYADTKSLTTVDTIGAYLPGAFGQPLIAASSPYVDPAVVDHYALPLDLQIAGVEESYSFYGNVTAHLPFALELSGGLREIHDRRPFSTVGETEAGVYTLPNSIGRLIGSCSANSAPSAVYGANFCDVSLASGVVLDSQYNKTFTPTLYNVSLSHKFSRDVLAYFTTGTSYRTGIPNTGLNVTSPDLLASNPEYATSYELGLKSTMLDRRLKLNVDVFQIDYDGQLTSLPGVNYYDVVSGQIASTPYAFYRNVNARVRGLEAETDLKLTQNLTLGGQFSYALIQSQGSRVPCNSSAEALSATNIFNYCTLPVGKTLNPTSPVQATVTGEYTVPLNGFDGYVRVLLNIQGHNPAFGYDVSEPAYQLLNLFAGVRDPGGRWDFGAYAKNALDEHTELNRSALTPPTSDFGPTGLSSVAALTPIEAGVTFHYAFGSR